MKKIYIISLSVLALSLGEASSLRASEEITFQKTGSEVRKGDKSQYAENCILTYKKSETEEKGVEGVKVYWRQLFSYIEEVAGKEDPVKEINDTYNAIKEKLTQGHESRSSFTKIYRFASGTQSAHEVCLKALDEIYPQVIMDIHNRQEATKLIKEKESTLRK